MALSPLSLPRWWKQRFPKGQIFKKDLIIYLRERDKSASRGGAEGEGLADSVLSAELDGGLHPTNPRL